MPDNDIKKVNKLFDKAFSSSNSKAKIAAYNELIQQFKDSGNDDIRLQVAMAMFNKGVALDKTEAKIAAYDEFVLLFENSGNPDIQLYVARVLVNKGNSLSNPKAKIATYDKVVLLFENSDNPEIQEAVARALFNKGIVLDKPEEKIVTYNKIISLFKNSDAPEIKKWVKQTFFNKGLVHKSKNQWTKAVKSFDGYLRLEGLPWSDLYNDIIKSKKDYAILLWALISIFKKSKEKINEVQISTLSDENTAEKVCHFTSIDALYSILGYSQGKKELEENKNILRAYNAIYMNDPSEGKALIDYSHNHNHSAEIPDLIEFFKDGEYNWIDHDAAKSVYSISFTEDDDSLTLWRAYGRDGDGVAIVIPVENLKQTDSYDLMIRDSSQALNSTDSSKIKAITKKVNINSNNKTISENLFRVQYINLVGKEKFGNNFNNDSADNFLKSLKEPLDEIINIRGKYKIITEEINKATRESFAGALYLFKDAQYAAEKEYRMLTMRRRGDKSICMDEQTPPHLHLETRPFVFKDSDTEIIIGPAVERPENVALSVEHILAINDDFSNDVKVKYSKVNYRPAKK
jgi:Protein of unknown function (DUF2971)